jgi:hypothetical protein
VAPAIDFGGVSLESLLEANKFTYIYICIYIYIVEMPILAHPATQFLGLTWSYNSINRMQNYYTGFNGNTLHFESKSAPALPSATVAITSLIPLMSLQALQVSWQNFGMAVACQIRIAL